MTDDEHRPGRIRLCPFQLPGTVIVQPHLDAFGKRLVCFAMSTEIWGPTQTRLVSHFSPARLVVRLKACIMHTQVSPVGFGFPRPRGTEVSADCLILAASRSRAGLILDRYLISGSDYHLHWVALASSGFLGWRAKVCSLTYSTLIFHFLLEFGSLHFASPDFSAKNRK